MAKDDRLYSCVAFAPGTVESGGLKCNTFNHVALSFGINMQ